MDLLYVEDFKVPHPLIIYSKSPCNSPPVTPIRPPCGPCDPYSTPPVIMNSLVDTRGLFSGFYCPTNTTFSSEFPCPSGTFSNITHRTKVEDCEPCAGGYYCETAGLSQPTAMCDAGKLG